MPFGAAAGLATLRIIQNEKLVENARQMGNLLGQRLHQAFDKHPHIGDIRGRGLFWGLELVKDRTTTDPFHASRKTAWRVMERAFDLGLVVYYSQGCADGINGDIIMLGPPLIINPSQIDELVDILAEAISQEIGP